MTAIPRMARALCLSRAAARVRKYLQLPVQVAVVAVRVVQHASDGEVDVVAVRDGGVSAGLSVRLTALDRGADARAPAVDVEAVLVRVLVVRGVQVPVVQVVAVVAVRDGGVPAVRPVAMGMRAVLAAAHDGP
jgi:hypothetical protein